MNEDNFWFQIDTVSDFPVKKFPASAWTSEINTHSFIAGVYDAKIWHRKYWTVDAMKIDYKNHIISHSAYYVSLPEYYMRLLTILN